MRLGRYIFLGLLIGLGGCVWVTLTQPRMQADKTPATTPLPTTATAVTPTPVKPAVAGVSSIKVLLYGVKLEVTDPIEDLVYGEIKDGSNIWAGFTTKKLLAKYPDCKAGALGTLVRKKTLITPTASPTPTKTPLPSFTPLPTRTPTNQPFSKTIAGYTYTYRPAYSYCTDDPSGRNELAADRTAIKNATLPTLSN